MSEKKATRKPRADAQRNRQRLLEVAKVAFAERGMSASLEDIARTAGVGIGTLYRHFPTRDVLINEIYREQGDRLAAAAETFSEGHSPTEAISEWLRLFVHALENKQIMAGVLSCISDNEETFCTLSGEVIVAALDGLIERAKQSGDITQDADSLDLLCAIAGIASYHPTPQWETSANRLIDIVIAGLTVEKA
ncbi:TetR/AcrR family transcriptional regulator [Pectobacterium peruviense]|uniref:TetR/AcrR family transcriptional regulator n=1 Tax=Pectobacterium peruviense TaxID=2066479 RepID=UPI000DE20275|nr:TetR/AcrR family transcriptional regulator [Pectobacterium peruviense]